MRVNEHGLALIKRFEGFRAAAYRDATGVWTIGYGHTSMAGEPRVTSRTVISRNEATIILARDINTFAEGVVKALKVKVNDNQFSALVSFAYNVGLGNFQKSSVLATVNAQDFVAVGHRLSLWNKAGGKVLPGLVKRRAAEAELFASQVSAPRPSPETSIFWTYLRNLWALIARLSR